MECNAVQQTLIFLMGMMAGVVPWMLIHGLCRMAEDTQDRIIHHSRVDEHAEGLENESQKGNQ